MYSGVFCGKVKEIANDIVILEHARKIYSWSGAATVSQIARDGVDAGSKITCETVGLHCVYGAIEIIEATEKAIQKIGKIKEWTI